MSFNRQWEKYKLSDILTIIGGGTPKTKTDEYWNGNIQWISVKDINNDYKTVYETEKSITKLGLNNSSTKMLNKGDLIISARGTVGELAQLNQPMAFNQSCYGLRANDQTTNNFLYYLLKYKLDLIKKTTHGSVFDTITKDTFDILEVKIPTNIKEQKKIAKVIPNKLMYREYPAKISSLELIDKEKRITLEDLGSSVGNAEYTTGFLL